VLGTLADVYANPVMVDALIQGREGTITGETSTYEPALPNIIDQPKQIERWEPWVRAFLGVGELLEGINYRIPTSGPGFQVRSGASLIAEIGRPAKATFEDQIPMVLSWAELRNDRATEILAQIDPQYAFWASIVFLRSDRHRWTFELINLTLQFCVYVEMRFKHALGCWRPSEYNAQVQPMLTTPGHGTFPMGHATQAYAVAEVLKALLKIRKTTYPSLYDQLERQQARIATNRVIAGVHFPVDSMAGRMLGVALGEYVVARSTGGKKVMNRKFLAGKIDLAPTTDFNPFDPNQDLKNGTFYSESPGATVTHSNLLRYMWNKARDEVKVRFP